MSSDTCTKRGYSSYGAAKHALRRAQTTTRRTSFKAVPGELEGKGMRSFKDDQVNLFDAGKMDWITIKVANVTAVVPE